jgi:hypothetical protein
MPLASWVRDVLTPQDSVEGEILKDLPLVDGKGSSNPLPKLATAHRVIIGLGGILGHNAPVRWEPGSALVRQVSMARTSLTASSKRGRHGSEFEERDQAGQVLGRIGGF